MTLIVTHVSGSRMKLQGTDDVSRGSLKTGVTVGKNMIDYCPWGKSPIIMEPRLKTWIKTWAGVEAIFLTPEGWYTTGHDIRSWSESKDGFWYPEIISGTYIWSL